MPVSPTADVHGQRWWRHFFEKFRQIAQILRSRVSVSCRNFNQVSVSEVTVSTTSLVSTLFLFLCPILLSDFHKNASFRPNMLNYLNTTSTFGKQTKDNFINRKVQCMLTSSFIHSFAWPLSFGESRGAAARGEPKMSHDQQKFQIVLPAPHQDGTKQGWRCSHVTQSLDELWASVSWVYTVARRTFFAIPSWDILETRPN